MTATLVVSAGDFSGSSLTLEGPAFRHLFRSRRLAPGAGLRAVDGAGRARWARVESVGRRSAEISLAGEVPSNEPAQELHLWTAFPRPERAAWLVEKVTEVGAAGVTFFRSQRSARPLGAAQLARLHRVATAAVEQCHRARVPEIRGERSFDQLLSLPSQTASAWFLHPESPALSRGEPGPWVLAVGPEGGWDREELVALQQAGFSPAGLGERSLRVETAAVVGAAMLLLKD